MNKFIFFLILGLHLLILSFLQFTAWPELLAYPYLFSKGFVLFKDFVIPYTPGLILTLALIFNIFKFDPFVLKTFSFIAILFVDYLIYLNLSQINKSKVNLLFLLIYIILQSLLDGDMMWFDFATTPLLLIALFFANNWLDKKEGPSIFFTGIAFSLAILVKQIAFIYPLGFLIFSLLIIKKDIFKQILIFFIGLILPQLPFLIYLLITNSLIDFWNWGVYYPLFLWSKFPGYVALAIIKRQAVILTLPFIPILLMLFEDKKIIFVNKKILLTVTLLAAAILAIYPRFSYFHFQPDLALLIILIFQIYNILKTKLKKILLIMTALIIGLEVYLLAPFNINSEIRFYTSTEKKLAEWIKKNSREDEKIFLIGPNASLYALSDRLPPKPWIDTFGWYMEIPGVQKQLLEGFKKDPPSLIFYIPPRQGNWFDLGVYRPREVVNYLSRNYSKTDDLEGVQIWKRSN